MSPEELKNAMRYPGWAGQLADALRLVLHAEMHEVGPALSNARATLEAFDRWEGQGLARLWAAVERVNAEDNR